MLILLETSSGYGLFRIENPSLLSPLTSSAEISKEFASAESASKAISLQSFRSFKDKEKALADLSDIVNSKVGKELKKFLKLKIVKKNLESELLVCDKSLGAEIQKKLGINVVVNPNTNEVVRGIRSQLNALLTGVSDSDLKTMNLCISHSLSRFKLKFSPDKIDTMVIQAIGLLDDLDKEVNNFTMRLKEYYGFHFPELTRIVPDNLLYARAVLAIGIRTKCHSSKKLKKLFSEDILSEIRSAAEASMGSEITTEDLENIKELGSRIVELLNYRSELVDYLGDRMATIAPNLTCMVGELVGARMIAHTGSLLSLAKYPSSTVQILGAEKALFRAIKQKSNTPKYGLIYHASLVSKSMPKMKGQISRSLAAKVSLCTRVDALMESTDDTLGHQCREYMEKRITQLQNQSAIESSKSGTRPKIEKYIPKKRPAAPHWEQTGASVKIEGEQ